MQDDFLGNTIDASKWETVINDTTASGGYAHLNFHVDHPASGANTFRNAGLYGKTYFDVNSYASGLQYTYRMKLDTPVPKGLVAATYAISNGTGSEADFEALTNTNDGSANATTQTNCWNKGSGWEANNGSFKVTDWHTYQIQWTKTTVTWLIDGKQVRTMNNIGILGLFYTNRVPTEPMRIDVSYWKPEPASGFNWPEAFNNQLNNATSSATYKMLIDWVDVRTIGDKSPFPVGGGAAAGVLEPVPATQLYPGHHPEDNQSTPLKKD